MLIREHTQVHISPRTLRGTPEEKDSLQRYMEDVAASPVANTPLSYEEEADLARRVKLGDWNARTKLIESNLRFVISVAREYQGQGVPLGDLISAGNIGLITAAERFDETKGFKFISYAVWWIRQAILMCLAEHSRVVRLPLNRVDTLRRAGRITRAIQQRVSRRPSDEEIAEEMDVSVDYLSETMAAGQQSLSLDTTFGDDSDNSLLEVLPDSRQEPPDALLMRNSLEEEIETVLGTLEGREAEVLRLYFGIGGGDELTLEEIGVKFGLTRERIRQIKEKALRKLRHPTRGKKLLPYHEEA